MQETNVIVYGPGMDEVRLSGTVKEVAAKMNILRTQGYDKFKLVYEI